MPLAAASASSARRSKDQFTKARIVTSIVSAASRRGSECRADRAARRLRRR
jgi:hypothetical protein